MYLRTKKNVLQKCLAMFIIVCCLFTSASIYGKAAVEPKFKTGSTYSGFELVKREYKENVKSYINEFQHKKTGAKLIYAENNDEQKRFTITFRTPCTDNTGVNHILEHSVLCGSEKFPIKNPFAKLINKSLNTEMNAYTYPDKTSYVVSSKYDKDFNNLVSVYLDGIFSPNIYKTKNIFQQEGWRYELASKGAELKYNGVVYNEMKGVYSKPDEVLQDAINKSLFPDTCYKYQSGGNPSFITNLTYEKYLETHKKYYHPSNSYTYIYGNVDILKLLQYIDENYFSKYEKKTIDSKIGLQKPFKNQNSLEAQYNVPQEEKTDNKTFFSFNYVVDTINNKQDFITLGLLNYLMMYSPKAPLKNALKDAGFNEADISVSAMPILQPVESIILRNANYSDKEKFKKIINDTYTRIIAKGFDKEDVQDLLNQSLKNRKLDKAFENFLSINSVLISNSIDQSWIYGGDPTLYLDNKDVVQDINNRVKKGERYFENFLSKYLFNNNHSSFVTLNPKAGLDEEINNSSKKALAQYKSKLSNSELDKIIKNNNEFVKWQNTPDSNEALNALPKLSLEDLKKPVVNYPTEEKNINGVKVLNHELDTSGASYIKLFFNTNNVPQDKLVYLNLLGLSYGMLERSFDTKNYTSDEFTKECEENEIVITVLNSVMTKYDDDSKYKPMLTVSAICPNDSISKTLLLTNEMLFNSKFNNKEKIRDNIKTMVKVYNEVQKQGGLKAVARLQSYFSPGAKYNSELEENFYSFIVDLDKNFDKKIDEVIKNLNEVKALVFNKENLVASFTSDKESFSDFQNSFAEFSKGLGETKYVPYDYKFDYSVKNEAYITDEKVQTVAKGYNFNKLGYKYSGSLDIVGAILNDYLFNTVRIKNGAYGAVASIQPTGSVIFASFSDPNLKETLDTFDSLGDYLKSLKISDEELEAYIIAALGQYDTEIAPVFISAIADAFNIFGDDANKIYEIREQILNTKLEDINKFGDMINEILKQNNYCAAGNREKIEENKDLFTKIIDISK